jgi:hypothetical protein
LCGGQGIPVFQTVSPVARGVDFQQHPREAGIWPSARVNNQKKCPAGLLQPDIFEPVLLTQAEFFDQCAVFKDILLGVVGKEAFTLTNHSEQGTAGSVIFLKFSQVGREALDTVGQEGYLYLYVTRVIAIFTVLFGDFSDFFLVVIDCHFLNFSSVKENFYRLQISKGQTAVIAYPSVFSAAKVRQNACNQNFQPDYLDFWRVYQFMASTSSTTSSSIRRSS